MRTGGEAAAAHALATGQQNHDRLAEQVDVGGERTFPAEMGDNVLQERAVEIALDGSRPVAVGGADGERETGGGLQFEYHLQAATIVDEEPLRVVAAEMCDGDGGRAAVQADCALDHLDDVDAVVDEVVRPAGKDCAGGRSPGSANGSA